MARRPLGLLVVLLAAHVACGGDGAPSAAVTTLHRFHEALVAGQRRQVRSLVTYASRPYVGRLPADLDRGRRPLRILDTRRDQARTWIRVRDENPDAPVTEGTYVVVREDGEWRVDLIASAGENSREEALPGGPVRLVPKQLSPQEIERARRGLDASQR